MTGYFSVFCHVRSCTLCNICRLRVCPNLAEVARVGSRVIVFWPMFTWLGDVKMYGRLSQKEPSWRHKMSDALLRTLRSITSAVSARREGRAARSEGCFSPREAILQKHTRQLLRRRSRQATAKIQQFEAEWTADKDPNKHGDSSGPPCFLNSARTCPCSEGQRSSTWAELTRA